MDKHNADKRGSAESIRVWRDQHRLEYDQLRLEYRRLKDAELPGERCNQLEYDQLRLEYDKCRLRYSELARDMLAQCRVKYEDCLLQNDAEAAGELLLCLLELRNVYDTCRLPKAEWPRWEREIRQVRLELRKLLDRFPEAFAAVLEMLVASRGNWTLLLPPRASARVPRINLVHLLADYRNAQDLGWTRLDFFNKRAEMPLPWGDFNPLEGNYHSGLWSTPDAVEAQLKNAERRVKTDKEFANEVASWQDRMAKAFIGSMTWGRKNA